MTEVVASGSKKRNILPILLMIGGVLLIGGVSGAAVRWWQLDRAAQKAAQPTAVQKKADDIQNLSARGDFAGAEKQLTQALDNTHLSNDERAYLTAQQATAFENQKKYQEALDKYKEADALKPTQDFAESTGRVAEAMGNKELAISSYKLAIGRINKASPMADADKTRYQDMIRSLGGQP